MAKIQVSLLILLAFLSLRLQAQPSQPNIIIIYTDDQGYSDLGCYGAKEFATPNIDKLAKEGVRFTSFYAAQPVCSASRAALLTGCYPNRVGIHGALFPKSKVALDLNEVTIAEILKQKNYKTAMIGKWHLGDHPDYLPVHQGFDQYYGVPFSNDMWNKHAEIPHLFGKLPIIENDHAIDSIESDQRFLTTEYTKRAVKFIADQKDHPFFLYLAHNMPHVPLFVSDKFKGKSKQGLYGDVIEEIDWSVGEIVKTLRQNHLDKNTLVIFTSDNGPWLSYGNQSGLAQPLREGKGTVWEGGVRVPCIMRWPGKLKAGEVIKSPMMNLDILPTLAAITGSALPTNIIDGKNMWPFITSKVKVHPQEAYFFYYNQNELQAIRSGKWKLYFPHQYRSLNGRPGGKDGIPAKYDINAATLELYNLEEDVSETKNVVNLFPDVVKRLSLLADSCRTELGDSLEGIKGRQNREAARPVW